MSFAEPPAALSPAAAESIVEPNAKRRLGTALQMPKVALTDDDVERIVDYLVELKPSN